MHQEPVHSRLKTMQCFNLKTAVELSKIPFALDMDAGGATPRMGEVELRSEQHSRAPTVGALGDAWSNCQGIREGFCLNTLLYEDLKKDGRDQKRINSPLQVDLEVIFLAES